MNHTTIPIDKPWRHTPSSWCIAHEVHEPWIAEISPYQMGAMSKRARERYGNKRNAEWDAAAACKQRWADALLTAFDRAEFKPKDADVTAAAGDRLFWLLQRREEDAEKARHEELQALNTVKGAADIQVGQEIYSVFTRSYGTVVRINNADARIAFPDSRGGSFHMRLPFRSLHFRSPDDLTRETDPKPGGQHA